jgi:hypothetical protein
MKAIKPSTCSAVAITALVALMLTALPIWAQVHQLGSMQDGAGRTSTNTVALNGLQYRHESAASQPGGVSTGAANNWLHYAGFLQAVDIKRADLDTDGDGRADELDADNDDDSLADRAEVDASAFGGYASTDPNDPDTDADGMTDDREAAGLFDPLDPNHRLYILDVGDDAGHMRINWVGKGGGTTNTLLAIYDLVNEPFTNELYSAAFAGGDAPWYKTTNTYAWSDDSTARYFRVRSGR